MNEKYVTPIGTFTNDQWNFDHRGPNRALNIGAKWGLISKSFGGWMDHIDTNKLGNRSWEYISEPYANETTVFDQYAEEFEYLIAVGWDVKISGTEDSVWAAIWNNSTIHISIVKQPEHRLVELEESFDKKIEELKAERKKYGKWAVLDGTTRTLEDVRQDIIKYKELRKLVRTP